MTLFLDSPLEAERAQIECPGIEVVRAANLVDAAGRALEGLRNQRIGIAPRRLLPRGLAVRAGEFHLSDRPPLVDRLLMGKLPAEIAAVRRAAQLADEGYAVFMQAARPGRADYELVAEVEAFFRARGVDAIRSLPRCPRMYPLRPR